ncbi:protein kinase [Streptomyces sp. NEAU-H22]|uniref:serine/threonine-protein kinase n=1 Tax=Streptomyces sp. NEAU-H22 TaxID=2994655 RepID=UPI00225B1DA6|nr:serine/threonine protein kinase [Streptomyces sp. NEAU-H22]MCX3285528.1 protein kinase [Streptomyces sp. NEAU-H22]
MGTEGHNRRVIAGRYQLEEKLGRGGMSVVWRATDRLLGRSVAVKELPYDDTLSAAQARRQRDRTLREARAVAQLSHPHIIVVHDVVEDDERPYIVMELIEGGSLADRLAHRGPVDAAEAARIGIALLGALAAAHAGGVLHRDLKPDNVLLETGTDRVVLTDFGIAQVAGTPTLTENGAFVGSPEYTAPERMSGARTGPESDLWSLGALLCAALSGESPFHRDSLGGILHAVVVGDIQPPAQVGPLMPVVRGLLERDPDRRLDAARAERMLRAFRDTGFTPMSPPPEYAPTVGEAPRRRPLDLVVRRPSAAPVDPSGGSRPEEPFLRQPARRVLIAALLVAAMAGAGVSAAALLRQESDGDGGPTPTSSASPPQAPATPKAPGTRKAPTTPAASPSAPAPTP